MAPKPHRIIVNHGESEGAVDFARQVRQKEPWEEGYRGAHMISQ